MLSSVMSQNKFMHPRNIYKTPPSFKEMAIKYPEFRKFAKPDLSGKITFDFKDPAALRALTCTLLEKDFGLSIDIPLSRLIPTLPLRLNYLLWIEDLLDALGIQRSDYTAVNGIDIGTGASCIYPLLAAKQNKWHMTATEVDSENFETALKNIHNNGLQHLVTVKLVDNERLLTDVIQNDTIYTFSMCNPPFFSCESDLDFTTKSRSSTRTPPHNVITGDLKELVAPGGEVAFILRMMDESKQLSTKIRIYTTMVGHKSSLAVLKLQLNKLSANSVTETRFCQGNTTRWGVAWTFEKNLSLQKAYQTPSQKKTNSPMSYIVPPEAVDDETMYTVENITLRVIEILNTLEVQHSSKKRNKYMTMLDITAFKNTWSHQRYKKRLQSNKEKKLPKDTASYDTNMLIEDKLNLAKNKLWMKRTLESIQDEDMTCKKKRNEDSYGDLISNVESSGSAKTILMNCLESDSNTQECSSADDLINMEGSGSTGTNFTASIISDSNKQECCAAGSSISNVESSGSTETILMSPLISDSNEQKCFSVVVPEKTVRKDKETSTIIKNEMCQQASSVPLLETTLFVRRLASEIHIELLWKGGTGGREIMHQVMQYIKNKLQ